MTFTKDGLAEGKALHADLGRLLQERKSAGKGDIGSKLSYLLKKDDVRSFWLRHGEDALAALEEAWRELAEWDKLWRTACAIYPALKTDRRPRADEEEQQ